MRAPGPRTPAPSVARIGLVGGLLVALGPVSLALYMPALPAVVADLDTSAAAVKLTMTSYFIGLAIAQLVCGPLSDAFGRRPVTLWFVALYVLASLACAFAPTVETLVAARFVQGFGASVGLAVARAIVRDGFTGEAAARLYNLIGLTLAIGPAVSPTIGALTLAFFDWHALFAVMIGYGVLIFVLFFLTIPETNRTPDRGVLDPARMAASWRALMASRAFVAPTTVMSMAIGGIHAAAAFMPFVLIEAVGLSPFGFALAMLLQSGAYVGSTLIARFLLPRIGAARVMRIGVGALVAGGVGLALTMTLLPPSVPAAMGPIMFWMLGIAFTMPGATSEAMAPFPHIAGSASAVLGFFQLGGGFAGSAVGALFADPMVALAVVLPGMAAIALAALAFVPREGGAVVQAALAGPADHAPAPHEPDREKGAPTVGGGEERRESAPRPPGPSRPAA